MGETSWHREARRVKKRYIEDIKDALREHGILVESDEHLERGLRAVVHAVYATPIGFGTYPRKDLDAIKRAVWVEKDFARTLFQVARKYGERLPKSIPPEAYVEQVAEQPRWTIMLSQRPKRRRTGTKLGDLKLEMTNDIWEITQRAYKILKKMKTNETG